MKTDPPLVSIGLPIYNGEKWLDQAIKSLTEQNYENYEILIADDCSNDKSLDICLKYGKQFPKINIERNSTNLGSIGNFKKTLRKANGKYFVYASQDDFWEHDFISTLVNKLEENSSTIMAMGRTYIHADNDESIREVPLIHNLSFNQCNLFTQGLYLVYPFKRGQFIKNNLFFHGVINTQALRAAEDAFPGVMGIDRMYLMQLALSGKWIWVDKILYHRRMHNESLSERRPLDQVTRIQSKWFFPFTEALKGSYAVIMSKNIVFYRKFYILVLMPVFLATLLKPALRFFLKKILTDGQFVWVKYMFRK
jgi:glycosyltransferase involved in cell wall biosynthesis